MADLIQNSQLVVGTGTQTVQKIAGGTVNAGMPCYLNGGGGDGYVYAASASGNLAQTGFYGLYISLATAYAGQPVTLMTGGGSINLGTTDGNGSNGASVNGQIYCVSYNAGRIAPAGDLNSGCKTILLGVLVASVLNPAFLSTNQAHP